jgi:Domain of unknown function (DUF5666)
MLTARTCYRPLIFLMLLAISLSAILSGCGDGGGGGGGNSTTPGTTPSSSATTTAVVSTGPITGFGSVILNGIEFETTQAEIKVEDQVVREDELRIGMRVAVEGVRDNNGVARATRVVFRKNVEGLIDSIDLVNNTKFVVLGQTVHVDSLTVIEDRAQSSSIALSALAVGQFVEVSGLVDANGEILATRIERKTGFVAGVTEVEVRGTLSGLNTNARTFALGALTVNFSTATVVGSLSNGVFVQVRGTQTAPGSIVTATRVTVEDPTVGGAAGTKIEVEGFVTVFTSATVFSVNGQAVTTTAQTVFENGAVTDLAQNVRLEVEGQLDANRTLVAEKISFRRRNGGNVRIEADVEAVTTTTVTLLGLVVRVDPLTQFKDDMGGDRQFRFDRIRVGDRLEIRGDVDAQGNIVATRLRRRPSKTEVVLQGSVESIAFPNLVIRRVTIQTNAATVFEDFSPNRPTATQFFTVLRAGTLVKVKGVLLRGTPVTIQATKVELEDPDINKDDDL